MDSKKLEQLLAKYWECETSLEEEKQLRDFFSSAEVPKEFKSVAELFRHFESNDKTTELGNDFDEKLFNKIKSQDTAKPKGKVIRWISDFAKVAAVLVILVTAGYYLNEQYNNAKDEPYMAEAIDTFEDPKVAFEETKKALLMISKNFKKGKKEASKLGEFNSAKEKIKNRNNEL